MLPSAVINEQITNWIQHSHSWWAVWPSRTVTWSCEDQTLRYQSLVSRTHIYSSQWFRFDRSADRHFCHHPDIHIDSAF